jgi:hypothetical protein
MSTEKKGTGKSKATVWYDNGDSEEFNPNRPRLLLDMEDKFGVQTPDTHHQVFWLAHRAVGGGKDFDEWVDGVEEVVMDVDKADSSGEGRSSTG